ncbi:hypothetical protein [Candidatus Liberibacter solanacearum]|uniref:hypothetical protein n=1 Tax=Candidatus Liberibacter solanacearum TaxID=556287 RepID=UPI000978E948|nr:hypothetical protein [Candidatus Liberibacter solanacearum]
MRIKLILIATTLITSGLLAGCDLADSSDHVKASSNVQGIEHEELQSKIEQVYEDLFITGSEKPTGDLIDSVEIPIEDNNIIEVIHNEDNNGIVDITID